MDQKSLEVALADLPIEAIRYFSSLGSTNEEAARWVDQEAPDLALVVADEQTAGRGRARRRWYTAAGGGLAFSLVLHPLQAGTHTLSRMTGLGALAVQGTLAEAYGLQAKTKWPNDVLLDDRKTAGVLAEAHWEGNWLQAVVLGIGINVAPYSVSEAALPPSKLDFPATCVEAALGRPVDRLDLLHKVLGTLIHWLPRLASSDFLRAWEGGLAYRGLWVQVAVEEGLGSDESPANNVEEGRVIGLAPDGSLKLRTKSGKIVPIQSGVMRLRPTT